MDFEFRIYNIIFEHFDSIKKIMNESIYFYKDIINTVCNKSITKIKKYYSKIEDKNGMLYNLTVIFNLINKLNIHNLWDQKNNNDKNDKSASHKYKKKHRKKFKDYFHRYYKNRISDFLIKIQEINKVDRIMQNDNAIVIILNDFQNIKNIVKNLLWQFKRSRQDQNKFNQYFNSNIFVIELSI